VAVCRYRRSTRRRPEFGHQPLRVATRLSVVTATNLSLGRVSKPTHSVFDVLCSSAMPCSRSPLRHPGRRLERLGYADRPVRQESSRARSLRFPDIDVAYALVNLLEWHAQRTGGALRSVDSLLGRKPVVHRSVTHSAGRRRDRRRRSTLLAVQRSHRSVQALRFPVRSAPSGLSSPFSSGTLATLGLFAARRHPSSPAGPARASPYRRRQSPSRAVGPHPWGTSFTRTLPVCSPRSSRVSSCRTQRCTCWARCSYAIAFALVTICHHRSVAPPGVRRAPGRG